RWACARVSRPCCTAPSLRVPRMSASPLADPLHLARELILRPSGLDDGRLDRVFGEVLTHSVDFADLYFQLTHQESWSLEDGMVKDGTASIEQGVGVRALAGEKTGFAYSDEIVLPALEEASRAARALQRLGAGRAGRPPRAGLRRRRRSLLARGARGGRPAARAGPRGRAPGAGQSRRAPGARRHHDRGARPRLAGDPAARGDRP